MKCMMSKVHMRLKVTPLTPLYIKGVLNAKSTRKCIVFQSLHEIYSNQNALIISIQMMNSRK